MRKLLCIVMFILLGASFSYATEIRLLGNRDLSWGSSTWVSTGGATVYRINADIMPFSQDNAVKVGTLYYFAVVATTGDAGECLQADGDNTFSWGVCGGTTVTSLPWDNITSRPTINGVTVTGAVLDNASNYPTLNQDTTGNASTAGSAVALTADPANCSAGQIALGINAAGVAECTATPSVTSITGSFVGNADTATALDNNPTDCGGGQYATGIDAGGNLTCGTPSGSGDMLAATYDTNSDNVVDSAIATAIQDNLIVNADINVSAAIDATKIGAGGVTTTEFGYIGTLASDAQTQITAKSPLASPTFTGVPAAPTAAADTNTTQISTTAFVIGQGYAKLVSPSFTTPTLGVASATTLNTGQGAYELYAMNQNVRTPDNVTFGAVTADEFVSSAADNTRGVTVPNTADPTGANLAAGKCWFDITNNTFDCRNGDNTATLSLAAGGITAVVEDTTPQLGGDLDLNTHGIDNVSQVEMEYLNGVTSGIQAQFTGKAATDQTMNIGTTAVAINRASAALVLTGITSIDGSAATATTAGNLSGTPALPNGVTATTQTAGSNDTKLATTAYVDSKKIPILDNVSGPSAAQSYGSLNRVTGAITVTLPTAVLGMSTCVMDSGTAHDVIVDVQGGDTLTLNGTEQAAGVGITNASGSSTGDMVCLVSHAAGKWSEAGTKGTWASQ